MKMRKKKFRGEGKNPRAGSTCAGRRLPLAEQLCGLEGRQDEEERKDRSLGEGGSSARREIRERRSSLGCQACGRHGEGNERGMKGQRRERERRSNHVQRCQRFPSSRQEETHFQQKWERATQHFKCFGAAVISSIWFRKKLKRTPDEQVEIRVFFFVAPERELFFESAPVKCPAAIHGPAKAKKKKKKKKTTAALPRTTFFYLHVST